MEQYSDTAFFAQGNWGSWGCRLPNSVLRSISLKDRHTDGSTYMVYFTHQCLGNLKSWLQEFERLNLKKPEAYVAEYIGPFSKTSWRPSHFPVVQQMAQDLLGELRKYGLQRVYYVGVTKRVPKDKTGIAIDQSPLSEEGKSTVQIYSSGTGHRSWTYSYGMYPAITIDLEGSYAVQGPKDLYGDECPGLVSFSSHKVNIMKENSYGEDIFLPILASVHDGDTTEWEGRKPAN